MKNKIERRNLRTEVRVAGTGDARRIEGYASVFNVPYTISDWWDEFEEIISPVAFNRALAEKQDVRCLFNHDPNFILGRTKPGTLVLSVDTVGLKYVDTPPAGPMATHVTDAVERGDVDGASFGFIVKQDSWADEFDDKGNLIKSTRTILDVDLYDCGPVTFPANDSATAGIRSLFPQGMPSEIRSRFEKRNTKCECECAECMDGRCAECSNPDCDDPNCEAEDGERSVKHRAKRERKAPAVEVPAPADPVVEPAPETNANAADPEAEKRAFRLRAIQASLE
jgi:HK97 family phage prohead protease